MGSNKSKKRNRDDSEDSSLSDADRVAKNKKERKHKKDKKAEKEEKEKLKQAKKFLKRKLKEEKARIPEEDLPLESDAQIDKISSDSYFVRNPEFTAWLRDERGKYFNDLPTIEARELFEGFVDEWNKRKLKRQYYQGGISRADARRTHHSWGISCGEVGGSKLGMAAALEEEREAREGRSAVKAEVRRWKKDQRDELEEMLPKATGREAVVEKRMARREDAHARDASPDIAAIPGGGDMYGGGDDSFAAARNREANRVQHQFKRNALKYEVAEAKVREAEAKEEEHMAKFRALIANGPIHIPKRT